MCKAENYSILLLNRHNKIRQFYILAWESCNRHWILILFDYKLSERSVLSEEVLLKNSVHFIEGMRVYCLYW